MHRLIAFMLSLLCVFSASANLFGSKPAFLTSQQAFVFSSEQNGDKVSLHWQIADGYYLYQKEVRVQGEQAALAEWQFPPSESYQDEFFGEVQIFRNQLDLTIPLQSVSANGELLVQYQGCTKGFCYPPETVKVPLQAVKFSENFAPSTEPAQTEQNQLAEELSRSRLAIFGFLLLGLGLAFTPCVLPMLPLLSAIVIGGRQRPNQWRAFALSLTYVQGMALTYTLLGLIVAAIGLPFQIALQSPPVLIGLSIVFLLLALSMFGLFNLQLPNSWQQKLNQLSQQQKGGSYPSVFLMGMIAGLVASPCTSAPLSGALLYVAQSGDLLTGGLALYLLALGMGIPLMLITLFGNNILPKSGEWLLKVKTLFGFVMLALPIFLLSRLLPSQFEMLLWSALAIAVLIWLNEQFTATTWWKKMWRGVLIALLIVSGKPWADLIFSPAAVTATASTPHFERVVTLAELQQKIAENRGKKVMLDLYADWCVACKEFEKYTFTDPQVKAELDNFLVLQVDMTQNSAANSEIMQHYQILGLPTLLFFNDAGQELANKRVTGFMQSEPFLAWLKNLSP